ncbi:MAG: hypothetical protein HKN73_15550, partial [Gemmatimonadetes bacterium]|nr:hypothetical protein [Gemmatimonadota bacterium]
ASAPLAAPLLAAALLASAPNGAAAQLCQRGGSSVIASIHVERIGVDPRTSLGFSFEPFDHVLLGGGLRWGGVDTGEETPRTVYAVTGGRLQAAGIDICPWVEGSQTRYDFRDRFEADRGAVAESTLSAGLELSRVVVEVAGLGVGVRLDGSMRLDERTMARRWLILDGLPQVETETTTVRETTWEESVGLFIQGRSFVLGAGASSYEYFGRHLAGFVEVSVHLGVD